MTTMREYRVVWAIDVTASSPRQAAQIAQDIQRRPGTTATVFDVVERDGNGAWHQIDLLENE